jgi:hypothetical protein
VLSRGAIEALVSQAMVEPWRLERRKLLARLREADRRIAVLEDEREAFSRQRPTPGEHHDAWRVHGEGMGRRAEAIKQLVADRKSLQVQLAYTGCYPAEPVRRLKAEVVRHHDFWNTAAPDEARRRGLPQPTMTKIERLLIDQRQILLREVEDVEDALVEHAEASVRWLEKIQAEAKAMQPPRLPPRKMTAAEREQLEMEQLHWERLRRAGQPAGPHPQTLARDAGLVP